MIELFSEDFYKLLQQSTILRGEQKYKEAIELIEKELPNSSKECYVNLLIEIIYSAQKGKLSAIAEAYAKELKILDPDLPIVKKVLGEED